MIFGVCVVESLVPRTSNLLPIDLYCWRSKAIASALYPTLFSVTIVTYLSSILNLTGLHTPIPYLETMASPANPQAPVLRNLDPIHSTRFYYLVSSFIIDFYVRLRLWDSGHAILCGRTTLQNGMASLVNVRAKIFDEQLGKRFSSGSVAIGSTHPALLWVQHLTGHTRARLGDAKVENWVVFKLNLVELARVDSVNDGTAVL
ncbi:hypothetical protein BJ741DRAFT_620664 [Chytriomyces cf. hyalinus JEL632]|nr:hypothetical protein BJ741DRAFT_620664 [Chytriomyces cf. hyalinus JEL632]